MNKNNEVIKSENISFEYVRKDKYLKIRKILGDCIDSWIKITEEKFNCRNCKPNKCTCDSAQNYDYYLDLENEIDELVNKNKLIYIGKDNYPVEGIIGKPVITFFRRLIHTRKICRYSIWRKDGGCRIIFN